MAAKFYNKVPLKIRLRIGLFQNKLKRILCLNLVYSIEEFLK